MEVSEVDDRHYLLVFLLSNESLVKIVVLVRYHLIQKRVEVGVEVLFNRKPFEYKIVRSAHPMFVVAEITEVPLNQLGVEVI